MSGLTQTGAVLGTPAYMSPEQAKGKPVDERSDLFSLGIIFYEILTGETPFKTDTMWASLLKRTQEPATAVTSIAPEVPQELSDIVAKCLAIDPAERYQNATEVALALDLWLGDTPLSNVVGQRTATTPQPTVRLSQTVPQPAMAPRPGWRRWMALAVAAVVVMVGFVLGWLKLQHKAKPPNTVTVLVADFTNHTGTRFSMARWSQCSTSPWRELASSAPTAVGMREGLPGNCLTPRTSLMSSRLG